MQSEELIMPVEWPNTDSQQMLNWQLNSGKRPARLRDNRNLKDDLWNDQKGGN